jgi:hypothetical protein
MKTWHRVAIAILVTALAVAGVVMYLETQTEYQVMSVSGYLFAVEDGTGTDQFTIADGGTVDVQGNKIDLDADADTSLTADTDDEVDFEIGGQDAVEFTASDATFQVDVYQQTPSLAKTSDYTATQGESGALLSNAGASGAIQLTLPAATPGLNYCIFVAEAYTITVDVDDADQILDLTNSTGDAIQNTGTVGDSVCVVALDTAEWANMQEIGTWSDVD